MRKAIPAAFTFQELLAHLREEPEELAAYRTAAEWAEQFGVTAPRMRQIIRQADEADLLLRAQAKRPQINLVSRSLTVYAFDLPEGNGEDG